MNTGRRAGSAPRWRPFGDGVGFLTLYLVLAFAIPSRLGVAPLGAAGTPAQLLGLAGLLWWVWDRVAAPVEDNRRTRPVRTAAFLLIAAMMASYVAGVMRPLSSVELNAMQVGLLSALGWLGVLLIAHDGIPDRARLEVIVQRIVLAVGLFAMLGVAQFVTGRPFTNLIDIPGLSSSQSLVSIQTRAGFNRPAGTALHPIEFGTILAMTLPLALHVLFHAGHLGRLRRWFPVLAIAVAIPLAISRSAIIGALVTAIIVLPSWTPEARRRAVGAMALGALGMFVLIPGFLGTITDLFLGVGSDGSARSRTDSYALAWSFIQQTPLTGRGLSTFLPEYRILDNQYLLTLIDMGLVGLITLLGLLVSGLVVALRCRRRATSTAVDRSLALALFAGIAGAGMTFAFFDAFAFPTFTGLTFVLLGLCGAIGPLSASNQRPDITGNQRAAKPAR